MRLERTTIILSLLCVACTAEVSEPISQTGDYPVLNKITFRIGDATKTSLSIKDVLWSSGDKISVFDGVGNRCFESVSPAGSSAVFCGVAAESAGYTLVYPYNSSASLSAGIVTTEIPPEQTATKDSFGPDSNLSIGICSDPDASTIMYNACALAKVTINTGLNNVRSVTLTSAAGEKLSGDVAISIEGSSVSIETITGANSYVSISSDRSLADGVYYLVVAPGTISGATLRFTMADGSYSEQTIAGSITFIQNRIQDLGSFVVNASSYNDEEADDPASNPVSAYSAQGISFSALVSAEHPRLFLNTSQMISLRDRVVSDPDPNDFYVKLHSIIMNNAVYYRDNSATPTYTLVNEKLLEQARIGLMRLFHFAYAYRMTGDASFLSAAKNDLAAVCSFSDWNASRHFLDNSELALAVAIAYDWLYSELTLLEKQAIHTALVNYELTPFASYTPTTGTNWNQVCNGGALAAAIVLYEKEKAVCAAAIDKAIASNITAVNKQYNPNGTGLEGYGYWEYAATYEAVIIQALESAFGTSCGIADVNGFKKTPSWKLFMEGVTGPFNFSDDCSESFSMTPVMIWFSARYAKPEYLAVEKYLMEGKERIGHRCAPLMLCAMQKYGYVDSDADFPADRVWSYSNDKSPLALVRIGWSFGQSDRYLGFKGSGGYNNHSHMDAGSFVYDALGKRWASDIPMGSYNLYATNTDLFTMTQGSLRWDILCQNNYFHNTLSFTKGAEKAKTGKVHSTDQIIGSYGALETVYNNDSDGYGATMDLTDYYSDFASSVKRTAKIKDGNLYIIDEITSYNSFSAPFEWRMITRSNVDVGENYITLTQGTKTMYLTTSITSGSASSFSYGSEDVERPSSWTSRTWDSAQSYSKYKVVKYSAKVPANTTTVFTTILSPSIPE